MSPIFQAIDGRLPQGADMLREHLRWVNAERRWHPALQSGPPDPPPPVYPPPGHAGLLQGALLTRVTRACAASGATASKEQ